MKLKFTTLGVLFGISIFSQITLSKDHSFGNGGVATFTFPSAMTVTNFEKVFINDDYSLNICLGTDGAYHTGMIAQLTAHGALDPAYNSTGKVILNGNPHTAFEFAKQGQKIVAIYANDYNEPDSDAKLVRYNKNGSMDGSFGVGGSVATRPDMVRGQLTFQRNAFYHLWGKLTGYLPNGQVNQAYGNGGNHNPVVNGVPHDYLELYSYFGNQNGKNFLNKYHYDIAVTNENSPHEFTNYNLMDHDFYTVAGATSGTSVYPKKFHLAADNSIAYLFGIDPNSGSERNRFVILDQAMQPRIFNGQEYIDLGEVTSGTEIYDLAQFHNQYVFVGKKDFKPVIFSYDELGNKREINGTDDFYENTSADDFSRIVVKDNSVYILGKKNNSHEVLIIKYNVQLLAASDTERNTVSVLNPFRDELKIVNAKNIVKVSLYDTSGRLLKSGPTATMPTADLAKGLYIVKIDFRHQKSKTFKAIKN